MTARLAAAVPPTPLRVGAVYLSPRGKLCTLLPPPARGPGSDGTVLQFAYLRRDGHRSVEDGFSLSVANARRLQFFMAPPAAPLFGAAASQAGRA